MIPNNNAIPIDNIIKTKFVKKTYLVNSFLFISFKEYIDSNIQIIDIKISVNVPSVIILS